MIHCGIDLGTTFSLISYVNAQGQPALFPDVHNANEFRTPSVVHIGERDCLVGSAAEELLEEDPALPVTRFVKLRMGEETPVFTDARGRSWSAQAISALILKKLKRDAAAFAPDDIGPSIVTVPAQFNDAQRRATKEAALLAGLGDVTLVEEPIAAATFYGVQEGPADRTLLVFDLGGGTFDVTLLQTSPDGLFALATDGAANIGGKAFDEAIMGMVEEDFRRRHGVSLMQDPASSVRLRRLAEDAKIKLAKPGRGQVQQSLLLGGKPYDFVLTRGHFQKLISPALDAALEVCERCLGAASLGWAQVDKILLAGGSSLLPIVEERIRIASGKGARDIVSRQPHQAVSFGAAILAGRLQRGGSASDALLQPVASADLGIRVWDRALGRPGVEVLIPRNSPLPAAVTRSFYTTRPDQVRMILEFLQQRGQDSEPTSLGHFAFGPIEKPRKNFAVEVEVRLREDGTVAVTARDPESGRAIRQELDDRQRERSARFVEERAQVEGLRVNE